MYSFPSREKPTLGNKTLACNQSWAEAWALEVRPLGILLWDYAPHKERAVSVPLIDDSLLFSLEPGQDGSEIAV